jgi:agmatine deiminase
VGLVAACTTPTRASGAPSKSQTGGFSPASAPAGVRWPAEWEPHERTMMAMPHKAVIYGSAARLAQAQSEWADVARAIAGFEPVTMVIPRGQRTQMGQLLGADVELLMLRYDDGWLRDSGPIVVDDGTTRTGLDFVFNGWGGAFDQYGQTWHLDNRLPIPLCNRLAIPRTPVDMVLEGGAVQNDGEGTLITTEECLLNPNRNPSMSKADIEAALLANFGAQKVIWLPYGLLGDLTSGHVDGVCVFVAPGRVLAQTAPDDPKEQQRLQANLDVLNAATDAKGRALDVVEIPLLPFGRFGGLAPATFTYVNLGFANGGVVVPLTGEKRFDTQGLGMIRDAIPDREVVGVAAPTINWAGGGVHCITQQVPA